MNLPGEGYVWQELFCRYFIAATISLHPSSHLLGAVIGNKVLQILHAFYTLSLVLWTRNYFYSPGTGSHFPSEFWIRVLLDLQKVSDPTLHIHSFTMPTTQWSYHGISTHTGTFQRKLLRLIPVYFK
jgi:hypothetical protein